MVTLIRLSKHGGAIQARYMSYHVLLGYVARS